MERKICYHIVLYEDIRLEVMLGLGIGGWLLGIYFSGVLVHGCVIKSCYCCKFMEVDVNGGERKGDLGPICVFVLEKLEWLVPLEVKFFSHSFSTFYPS